MEPIPPLPNSIIAQIIANLPAQQIIQLDRDDGMECLDTEEAPWLRVLATDYPDLTVTPGTTARDMVRCLLNKDPVHIATAGARMGNISMLAYAPREKYEDLMEEAGIWGQGELIERLRGKAGFPLFRAFLGAIRGGHNDLVVSLQPLLDAFSHREVVSYAARYGNLWALQQYAFLPGDIRKIIQAATKGGQIPVLQHYAKPYDYEGIFTLAIRKNVWDVIDWLLAQGVPFPPTAPEEIATAGFPSLAALYLTWPRPSGIRRPIPLSLAIRAGKGDMVDFLLSQDTPVTPEDMEAAITNPGIEISTFQWLLTTYVRQQGITDRMAAGRFLHMAPRWSNKRAYLQGLLY